MSGCLVIGGGLLGGHVALALAGQGHDVTVYSRSFGDELDSQASAIRTVRGEVDHNPALAELIDASDAVLYFAGGSTPAGAAADAGGSVELSVVPATTVLETMLRGPSRRIVLASSGGTVYGEPAEFPTAESHPTEPIGLHGHNALTIERYADFFGRRHGFEPVVLRIATAYGPGQRTRRGQGVIAAWMDAARNGTRLKVYGELDTRRDFVFAADVGETAARATFDARPGVYNVGSGGSHALAEVIEEIRGLSGSELEIEQTPARGVDVTRTELDCSRLESELGWAPATPLADGLRHTWDWTLARS